MSYVRGHYRRRHGGRGGVPVSITAAAAFAFALILAFIAWMAAA